MSNVLPFRRIDGQRMDDLYQCASTELHHSDIWYIHTVFAQCFLPYRDQKDVTHWHRRNGEYSMAVTADTVEGPDRKPRILGLPYGAKPRLFMSYAQTQAVKTQSPVIQVERSMTAMMKELGFKITGGKEGTISKFKQQTSRLAACRFRIIGPGRSEEGGLHKPHNNNEIFKHFDVWFPADPEQRTLWPSEIVFEEKFFVALCEHAVPYDFRALQRIKNNARAQDIFLWLTQRLCRIPYDRPVLLEWDQLYEMFGGGIRDQRYFPSNFRTALMAAYTAYPNAKIEERAEGYVFRCSEPPVRKTRVFMRG